MIIMQVTDGHGFSFHTYSCWLQIAVTFAMQTEPAQCYEYKLNNSFDILLYSDANFTPGFSHDLKVFFVLSNNLNKD